MSPGRDIIVVMRHGERADSVEGCEPMPDPPLTDAGIRDIAPVVEAHLAPCITHLALTHARRTQTEDAKTTVKVRVITSPFLRTKQTAGAVYDALVASLRDNHAMALATADIELTFDPAADDSAGALPQLQTHAAWCEVFNSRTIKNAPETGPLVAPPTNGTLPEWGEDPHAAVERFYGALRTTGDVMSIARKAGTAADVQVVVVVTHGDALAAVENSITHESIVYETNFLSYVTLVRDVASDAGSDASQHDGKFRWAVERSHGVAFMQSGVLQDAAAVIAGGSDDAGDYSWEAMRGRVAVSPSGTDVLREAVADHEDASTSIIANTTAATQDASQHQPNDNGHAEPTREAVDAAAAAAARRPFESDSDDDAENDSSTKATAPDAAMYEAPKLAPVVVDDENLADPAERERHTTASTPTGTPRAQHATQQRRQEDRQPSPVIQLNGSPEPSQPTSAAQRAASADAPHQRGNATGNHADHSGVDHRRIQQWASRVGEEEVAAAAERPQLASPKPTHLAHGTLPVERLTMRSPSEEGGRRLSRHDMNRLAQPKKSKLLSAEAVAAVDGQQNDRDGARSVRSGSRRSGGTPSDVRRMSAVQLDSQASRLSQPKHVRDKSPSIVDGGLAVPFNGSRSARRSTISPSIRTTTSNCTERVAALSAPKSERMREKSMTALEASKLAAAMLGKEKVETKLDKQKTAHVIGLYNRGRESADKIKANAVVVKKERARVAKDEHVRARRISGSVDPRVTIFNAVGDNRKTAIKTVAKALRLDPTSREADMLRPIFPRSVPDASFDRLYVVKKHVAPPEDKEATFHPVISKRALREQSPDRTSSAAIGELTGRLHAQRQYNDNAVRRTAQNRTAREDLESFTAHLEADHHFRARTEYALSTAGSAAEAGLSDAEIHALSNFREKQAQQHAARRAEASAGGRRNWL
jgi:phosphohistidine phosphatase SixA